MEDLTGKQFGHYQIVAPLGEGGMAAVYKAYQPAMERYVAIKVLPRHMASSSEFVARFKREARLLAQLQHSHILPVFDYGEAEGYPYIVMPFVPSGTLSDLLRSNRLSLAQVRYTMTQIGDALAYAHARGMIHRDVKPSNVLIDESGNCLLTDFGLARMSEASTKLTSSGAIMGTPAYMSPEQGAGAVIDHRSDIYSLGVMLYEMVTGRVPYTAETPVAIVFKHIQDPLPSARTINPALPEAVELVLLKVLAKNRDDRYQSAKEFVLALQKAIPDAEHEDSALARTNAVKQTDDINVYSGFRPTTLTPELLDEIEDTRPYVREAAVQKLDRILKSGDGSLASVAVAALEKIIADENTTRRVAQEAAQALEAYRQEEAERKVREEAERKAEAERQAREAAERKAEAERKAREEAERKAEVERQAREAAKLKAEAERKAHEAAEFATLKVDVTRPDHDKTDIGRATPQQIVPSRGSSKIRVGVVLIVGIALIGLIAWGISKFIPRGDPFVAATAPAAPTQISSPVVENPPTVASPTEIPYLGIEAPNDRRSENIEVYTEVLSYVSFDTLDPALAYDTVSWGIIQNIYETLVFYDGESSNNFVPMLAESWEVSADGRVWIFRIRRGVKFHNGYDLTPTDVAYSFQRGLLQGGSASPQYLLAEPFLGVGVNDISQVIDPSGNLYDNRDALQKFNPNALIAACEEVQAAIVADDVAGTVTMTLVQPWAPFLTTLAQPMSAIMSRQWVSENNGWDGSCSTWQHYYAMQSTDNPFSMIENGTGPFRLESYSAEEAVVLAHFDDYWRGPARLARVEIKQVPDWAARLDLIRSGAADSVAVPQGNLSDMDELAGERCEFDLDLGSFRACETIDDSQPLRVRLGFPSIIQSVALFSFDISASGNSYIGSGRLDGNGIPPEFFSDVHIRKAFSYCFDWDSFISKVYNGEAVQSTQIPLPGMIGYFPDMPYYTLDLARCEEEFKLADVDRDGIPAGEDPNDVWETGFRFQFPYNEGNVTREAVAEVLAGNMRSMNSNFRIELLGIAGDTYNQARVGRQLPLTYGGWFGDIHDPYQMFQPFVVGTFAARQSVPPELQAQFQELINRGVVEMNPSSRANIYRDASQLYYDQAIGFPLAFAFGHTYEQRWVVGRISNPLFWGTYYYPIFKR